MRYINEILQPGEKVLFYGRLHWIIYFPAVFLLLSAIWALFLSTHMQSGSPAALISLIAAPALALAASGMMFLTWFRRWTTELDVTDRRVVNKRGFITRHTIEMNMDKIESVDVDQSILGRILNYGDITIRGTGTGWDPICTVARPLDFRNHVTAR
jgi:uncharacterized membrane protein YdbT with pleckstrin-like domain